MSSSNMRHEAIRCIATSRYALNRIDYRLGMRWLAGDPPAVGAYFVDPRDMS